MAILTVAQLQEHVQTDLASAAIQRLLDAAERLIVRAAGDTAARTEYFDEFGYPDGRERSVYTAAAISTITSVSERDSIDDAWTALATSDYLQQGQRGLLRLASGANPRALWAAHVKVVYTPVTDAAIRQIVQVNLVKLWLNFTGAQSERIGDFDVSHGAESDKDVAAVLRPLVSSSNRMPLR